jgi:hypothetical protein
MTDPDALDNSASVNCSRESSRGKAESSENGGELHFNGTDLGWSWKLVVLLKDWSEVLAVGGFFKQNNGSYLYFFSCS